jgi:hypothetical protein
LSRLTVALSTALIAAAALATVPWSGAGAGTDGSCVAWAQLPARASLHGKPVVVHATLRATDACRGVTTDNGATATLTGGSDPSQRFPLRWSHIGATDTAALYGSLTKPGTYRITRGDLQTYDAEYRHIASTWDPTATVVKYAGRFRALSGGAGNLTARLQYYSKVGWTAHGGVAVALQRRSGDSWVTLARRHSSSSGRVAFDTALRSDVGYRLVSATTGWVWSATTGVSVA